MESRPQTSIQAAYCEVWTLNCQPQVLDSQPDPSTFAGEVVGDEVVELYLRDEVSTVTRPVKELKGSERITLRPGETRPVTFVPGPQELSFLNAEMKRVVEPGWFDVMIRPSSVNFQTLRLEVVER